MHPTNADFGRRLFSSTTAGTGGAAPVGAGLLLLALAVLVGFPTASTRHWVELLPDAGAVMWAAAGLGVAGIGFGMHRFRRSRSARHFYEDGACSERGCRRDCAAYADAQGVTFVVRTVGSRVERVISFAGPGGQPELSLRTDLAEDDAGDDATPSVRTVQNVATRVIEAAAARHVERVDRGEVVKWTDGLWLDQAGLRVDNAQGKVIPWASIDGVKDGSQSGKIEVYAFGGEQPVASARTYDVNALPGFKAFMKLLDRAQSPAVAA